MKKIPKLPLRLSIEGRVVAVLGRAAAVTTSREVAKADDLVKEAVGADGSSSRSQQPVTPDTEKSEGRTGIPARWRAAGAVVGQTTLIGALLYYFGWARTQAAMGYFGIDSSVARFSVNDYIIRSLNVGIKMLVILGLLALLLVLGHRWLSGMLASLQRPSMTRRVILICTLTGLLLCIAGLLGFYNFVIYSTQYPFVPVMIAVGVTLIGYGFHLYVSSRPDPQPYAWSAWVQAVVIIALDIILIFWTVAVYAGITGEQDAKELAANLSAQPSVAIYSEDPLGLNPPAKAKELPASYSRYRYLYTNLKLLLYSSGRYFLVPDNWERGREPVLVVDEGSSLRFEFFTGS